MSLIITDSVDTTAFNVGDDNAVESWQILVNRCKRAQQLRAEVLRVDMTQRYPDLQRLIRPWIEYTSTAGALPLITRGDLLDIADYCATTAEHVREFFLVLDTGPEN